MAYETFPWTTIDIPTGMEIVDHSHTIKHAYGGVYMAKRAQATLIQKEFKPSWKAMTSSSWIALTEFWRLVSGSADFFYWQFPASIYGGTGWGGVDVSDAPAGWDSEQDLGWGGGPIFLASFVEDSISQQYLIDFPNHWAVGITILEVA